MTTLIIIGLVIGGLIYYVLNLDFQIGTGFTEMKNKIREGEYRIVDEEDKKKETKLLNTENEKKV